MDKPEIDDVFIINKKYFTHNILITQYYPDMASSKPYQILDIKMLTDELWGITKFKDIETDKVFDIDEFEELSDYWCFLDEEDSFRVIAV